MVTNRITTLEKISSLFQFLHHETVPLSPILPLDYSTEIYILWIFGQGLRANIYQHGFSAGHHVWSSRHDDSFPFRIYGPHWHLQCLVAWGHIIGILAVSAFHKEVSYVLVGRPYYTCLWLSSSYRQWTWSFNTLQKSPLGKRRLTKGESPRHNALRHGDK